MIVDHSSSYRTDGDRDDNNDDDDHFDSVYSISFSVFCIRFHY